MNMRRSGAKISKIDTGEISFVDAPRIERSLLEKKEIAKDIEIGFATENSEKHPDHNEDKFTASPDTIAVYDGMGGSERGEEGAKKVKAGIEAQLSRLSSEPSAEALAQKLKAILVDISNEMYEASPLDPEKNDGSRQGALYEGSTASLLKMWQGPSGEKKAVIVHVGDSRVYRLRNGELTQLTQDQGAPDAILKDKEFTGSLSEDSKEKIKKTFETFDDEADLKDLTKKERAVFDLMFKFRASVTEAMGNKNTKPETYIDDAEPGDEYFITSDGIHDPLSGPRIKRSLTAKPNRSPEQKAKDLIAEVKKVNEQGIKRKKFDDKTVLSMRIKDELTELPSELLEDEVLEVSEADVVEIDEDDTYFLSDIKKVQPKRQPSAPRQTPPPIPAKKKAA